MNALQLALLVQAGHELSSSSTLSDSILVKMSEAFEARHVAAALQLVDDHLAADEKGAVITRIVAQPSGRYVYRVRGASGVVHVVLNNGCRCSCAAFRAHATRGRNYCKHTIALNLALAADSVTETKIGDKDLIEFISNME